MSFFGVMGIRDGWAVGVATAALLGNVSCNEELGETRGSSIEITELGPGERRGCPEGAVVLVVDGEQTAFCTAGSGSDGDDGSDGADGLDGQDGASGADGRNGTDGAQGPAGPPGEAGPQGPAGPAGEAAAFRTDCVWCTPGYQGCAPDGVTLQECVDDGDGCGHWEAVMTCAEACSYAYRADEPDALGNAGNIDYRCFGPGECSAWRPCAGGEVCVDGSCEPPGSGTGSDCRQNVACNAGQSCSTSGACETDDTWLVASATLNTAFDGRTHTFTALSESLSATCTTAGSTYWNSLSAYCSRLSIGARNWTESDEGAAFAGPALEGGTLYLNDAAGPGTYSVSCGSAGAISGNRFEQGAGAACSVTINEFTLGVGGHVGGTFSVLRNYKGHGEPDYPSTMNVTGSFRIAL